MAVVNDLTINVRLVPDEYTMDVILHMLNLWQDSNTDKMIALVPQKDRYGYEIISRGGKKNED